MLDQMETAVLLDDYEYRLGTDWSYYEETVRSSTAFASTTNGVSASSGKMTGSHDVEIVDYHLGRIYI